MKIDFPFVAVDWGTTRMRAMLCLPHQKDVEPDLVIEGPGISRLDDPLADTLFDAIEPWIVEFGELDILLGGMVGSNIGWRETPYLSCPLALNELGDNLECFEEQGHRILIVPGVSCVNKLGQPDVMRGEEIQVLGWMCLTVEPSKGDQLLCLPGTHTKWVRLSNGELTGFTTSLTGEVFALLRQHSVLVPTSYDESGSAFDEEAFRQGIDLASHYGDDLLHAVFSTRSRSLVEGGDFGDASSYLSGLLIGSDVRSALRTDDSGGKDIELIGARALCGRFAIAIEQLGYTSRVTEGIRAVHAGFLAIAAGDDR